MAKDGTTGVVGMSLSAFKEMGMKIRRIEAGFSETLTSQTGLKVSLPGLSIKIFRKVVHEFVGC